MQVIEWTGDSGDGVYIGGGDPNDKNHAPLRTMFRPFFSHSKAKQFQPSKKIKDIIEDSKIDASDLKPKLFWDPKNPPKPIWERFNVINNQDEMDNRGRIIGTDLDDYIRGTSENDTIRGEHGSDLIYGGDGDDDIQGDTLSYRATDGVDTVYGGNGNDKIRAHFAYGENGNDRLYAPHPNDPNGNPVGGNLNGGKGDDSIYGSHNVDTLTGGVGNDRLDGHGGGDIMTGGQGADKFFAGHGRSLGDLGGSPEDRDVIVDFRDAGDHITIPAMGLRRLNQNNVDLMFNNRGALVITVNDPSEGVSGVVAEVHGLDVEQPINNQINWINGSTFELA